MGVARRRVGILPENDGPDIGQRRRAQGSEHLLGRWTDDGAGLALLVQALGQRLGRAGKEGEPGPAMAGAAMKSPTASS